MTVLHEGTTFGMSIFVEGCALTFDLSHYCLLHSQKYTWEYYKTIASDDLCEAMEERETGSSLAAYTFTAILTFI